MAPNPFEIQERQAALQELKDEFLELQTLKLGPAPVMGFVDPSYGSQILKTYWQDNGLSFGSPSDPSDPFDYSSENNFDDELLKEQQRDAYLEKKLANIPVEQLAELHKVFDSGLRALGLHIEHPPNSSLVEKAQGLVIHQAKEEFSQTHAGLKGEYCGQPFPPREENQESGYTTHLYMLIDGDAQLTRYEKGYFTYAFDWKSFQAALTFGTQNCKIPPLDKEPRFKPQDWLGYGVSAISSDHSEIEPQNLWDLEESSDGIVEPTTSFPQTDFEGSSRNSSPIRTTEQPEFENNGTLGFRIPTINPVNSFMELDSEPLRESNSRTISIESPPVEDPTISGPLIFTSNQDSSPMELDSEPSSTTITPRSSFDPPEPESSSEPTIQIFLTTEEFESQNFAEHAFQTFMAGEEMESESCIPGLAHDVDLSPGESTNGFFDDIPSLSATKYTRPRNAKGYSLKDGSWLYRLYSDKKKISRNWTNLRDEDDYLRMIQAITQLKLERPNKHNFVALVHSIDRKAFSRSQKGLKVLEANFQAKYLKGEIEPVARVPWDKDDEKMGVSFMEWYKCRLRNNWFKKEMSGVIDRSIKTLGS